MELLMVDVESANRGGAWPGGAPGGAGGDLRLQHLGQGTRGSPTLNSSILVARPGLRKLNSPKQS